MENLDKCYKVVQQSRTGISAIKIAEELKKHRTTVHNYLNTLELMGKVYNQHGLWYPEEPRTKEKTAISDYLIERFWREEEEIEKENINDNPSGALEKAEFLRVKLPSPYKEKLSSAFQKVNKEFAKVEGVDLYTTMVAEYNYLKNVGVPFIIESISSVLHEMEKEGVE